MTTTIGKVLAVATMAASLVFLGLVVAATRVGGTNWAREAQNIEGYTFARNTADPPQWTAQKHVGQAQLPTSRNIEPVIVAVYDDMIRDERALTPPQESISAIEQQITAARKEIQADIDALNARDAEVQALLQQKNAEVIDVSQQVDKRGEEVQKLERQIQARREDVGRLQAQIDEVRTDDFRLAQIQQQLQDLIQQIDASLDRAKRRQSQLRPYK
jgi:chromosome segregation protein